MSIQKSIVENGRTEIAVADQSLLRGGLSVWKGNRRDSCRVLLFAKSQFDIDIVLLLGFVILSYFYLVKTRPGNMTEMIEGPTGCVRHLGGRSVSETCSIEPNVHFLRAIAVSIVFNLLYFLFSLHPYYTNTRLIYM